jgi:hypothetical protein
MSFIVPNYSPICLQIVITGGIPSVQSAAPVLIYEQWPAINQTVITPRRFYYPIFDGNNYKMQCTWNIAGKRWYINIYDQSNALVLCTALIGSTSAFPISMTAGYFKSTLIYDVPSSQFLVDNAILQGFDN